MGVVKNAFAGMGFASEAAIVAFPIELFLVESEIIPIKKRLSEFVDGLTKWAPRVRSEGIIKPPLISLQGNDFEEIFTSANYLFLKNMWGDGLPILLPTVERVEWILRGTDDSPETRIGKFMPKGGIVTVETLAITLAMAGGRPEYLPVLIAAVESILDPKLKHQQWQATSCSIYPVIIINGLIAKQIRLNAGFGLLGPDPRHPAGGIIGRAIRLLQQNVGGALPGVGTMAMYSGMRYTNAVFAENENELPLGWEPFNVEYCGFLKSTNTVAVTTVSGATNIFRRGTGKETLVEEAVTSLHIIASYMKSLNVNGLDGYNEGTPGILLISSTIAHQLSSLGWTKYDIKNFLWENSKISLSELDRTGFVRWLEYYKKLGNNARDSWPITSKPENITLVVAGGTHPTHAYWMQSAMAPRVVSAQIKLPEKWNDLINEAEQELGPVDISDR